MSGSMIGPDAPIVAGLVYIAAFGIDQGESLGALLSQGPPTPALAHLFTDQLGFGWLSHDDFVDHFAADADPIRANVMYAVQQGLAGSAFTEPPAGPSPSVVLVHRAWAGSSSWDAVVSDLQRDRYTVYVPPNPLLGISYDLAYIRDFLHTISGPIILVGHSSGGAVMTNAATGGKQVKALVYVDAFAPA